MYMKQHLLLLTIIAAQLTTAQAQTPAFPGAEGHGRFVCGGRGGKVVHVTNLNDSGEGSLRQAVSGTDKKMVVFDVGGTIELARDLIIGANTTILGQTAPWPGITLRYYTVRPDADNIVIRFIRVRRGEEKDVNDGADAIWTRHQTGMMIDHCSFSWSIDEVASFYDNRNFTMQWCTIAEALTNAGHGKGAHGYGGIWGGKQASFHHNLLAHLNNRVPRLNGARYNWQGYDASKYANTVEAEVVDLRNCVMFNWGEGGAYGAPGGGYHNIVNCYYKAGPGSSHKNRIFLANKGNANNGGGNAPFLGAYSHFYVNGNFVEGYGAYYDWNGIENDDKSSYVNDTIRLDAPVETGHVTTHPAQTAFLKVLSYAGASLARDAEDTRYMREAETGEITYTGSVTKRKGIIDVVADVGGYHELEERHRDAYYDTDGDGMPDAWEEANGLNPGDASDANSYTIDTLGWYTNIEVFANSLVQDIMLAGNADADEAVAEYYPAFTMEDGTRVEAIHADVASSGGASAQHSVHGDIVWALSSGEAEQPVCSAPMARCVGAAQMSVGTNLQLTGTRTMGGVSFTLVQPLTKTTSPDANSTVEFGITPADGYQFVPTKIAFLASRIGTDGSAIDVKWVNEENTVTLDNAMVPERGNNYTDYSKTVNGLSPTDGWSKLQLVVYNLANDKQVALANVIISGYMTDLSSGISQPLTLTMEPCYYNLQGMRVVNPKPGMTVVERRFDGRKTTNRKILIRHP